MLIIVSEWLNEVTKKHGVKVANMAYDNLIRWDNSVNIQTFYEKSLLEQLLFEVLQD